MEEQFLIINQSTRQRLKGTVNQIADYLDCSPQFVKLHIDKEVSLKGWEVKTALLKAKGK